MTVFASSTAVKKITSFISIMVAVAIPLRAIGVAPQQGALALALIGALIVFFRSPQSQHLVKQAITSRTGILIGSIFAAWTITVFFSIAPLGSLKIGGRTGLFLLAVILVWSVLRAHQENHRLMWKIFIVAALLSATTAALSLAGMPMVLSIIKADFVRKEIPAGAFKAFGASALCMIPVVVWAGRRVSGRWRIWAYAYLPLAIFVIFQTQNHAALAGLLAMIGTGMTVIILNKHRHTKILFVIAIAVVASIMAWIRSDRLVFTTRNIDGMYLPEWLIDPHRQQIWKFAYNKFLENPWFGNGIDQLNKLSGAHEIAADIGNSAFLIPSHPHNWALEILTEAGIIGFLPVVIALGYVAWRLIRHFLKTQDEGALAQLTLIAGFWASALFNFSIWAVWWQLTFFILFAIVSAAPPDKKKQS